MEEEAKPVHQPQRRLNPHMQEVVRAEVLKLLQAGIIYPISDSPWVSPTQVVPKKSRTTVVQNDKGEEVSTHVTSGWRVCIDYRKLNVVTRKDHFRCHLLIKCLRGTQAIHSNVSLMATLGILKLKLLFKIRRRPLSLVHSNLYIQKNVFRLMQCTGNIPKMHVSIFNDMVERIMEVFMDDIIVYGSAFDECLVNLEAVLNRCIEKNLVLNWEKCHFMYPKGSSLGILSPAKALSWTKQNLN
ncbi:Retrovirus-related Pol polyprotein from transposon opus [Vitis vinifera]|uniref:Retrovirus-related Pol polyprotein from transposon opus n=1 Tax=Vitis vinifera TaxID=29760 RepID=A0A438EU93_VITVI|nr:Retrovirus-related Pol polyprotein from transposon opus [Vitis vinifera]